MRRLAWILAAVVAVGGLYWAGHALGERRARSARDPVEARPAAQTVAEEQPEAPVTLRGTVYRKSDMTPIHGARVRVLLVDSDDAVRENEPPARANTDRGGVFEVEVASEQRYVAIAESDGLLDAYALVRPGGEASLLLECGDECTFWVVDHHGKPVEGARMHVFPEAGLSERACPVTDRDGRAELRLASDDSLAVTADGFEEHDVWPIDRSSEPARATIHLQPQPRLAGRVIDAEGAPVARALISCESRPMPWLNDNVQGFPYARQGVSDAAGRFDVPVGRWRYRVSATRPGFAPGAVYANAGQRVVVVLERYARVSGRVVTDTGAPAHPATVSANREMEDIPWDEDEPTFETKTSPDGSFTLAAPPGRFRLWARMPVEVDEPHLDEWPTRNSFGGVLELAPGETRAGLVLVLDPLAYSVLPLRFVRPDGTPIADAEVTAYGVHGFRKSDSEGRVRLVFDSEPGGEERVHVASKPLGHMYEFETLPPDTSDEVVVRVPDPMEFHVHVAGPDGAPLAADLEVEVAVEGSAAQAVERRAGHRFIVRVGGEADGPLSFSARAVGYVRTVSEPGHARQVEIRLLPAAVVVGRVVDPAGRPVSAQVHVGGYEWTDVDGEFRIDGVAAGEIPLLVWVEGGGLLRQAGVLERRVTVPPGGRLDLGTIVVPARVWVRGRVLDPAGRPAGGAQVWIIGKKNWELGFSMTEPDGTFSIDVPGGDELRAVAWRPGNTAALSKRFDGEPLRIGLVEGDTRVESNAPAHDRFEIRTAEGFPLPFYYDWWAETEEGWSALRPLPAGRLVLVIDGKPHPVDVVAGQLNRFDFR